MNIFLRYLFCSIFFILFTVPRIAYAVDTDIIITEIAAYESPDHEWIEIYNKGAIPIDLTGWKFFEDNTNHGLTAYRGGLIVQPQAYAVIADVAANTASDYPSYQGMLIDSSWTTLSESGELIGLKNKAGAVIEQFTFVAAQSHSLQRADATLSDYTASNWKEHSTGNTIGAQNEISEQVSIPEQKNLIPIQQVQPIIEAPKPGRGSVVLNEIVSDPSDEEKEWIELYNVIPNAVDLSGWTLTNSTGKTIAIAGMLQAAGTAKYMAVELSGGTLKNLGDKISLLDSQKNVIDSVSYGSWDDGLLGDNALRAVNPYSLARKTDGYNTQMNSNDFVITTTPTRGSANVITTEPTQQSLIKESQAKQQSSLTISELFPNPKSHDFKDEFIELVNDGAMDIDLTGWRLADDEGQEFIFSKTSIAQTLLKPKTYISIGRDVSGIALNNTGGETIKLYEPGSQRAQASLHYSDTAQIDLSYARDAYGRYAWTSKITQGFENSIVTPNRPPNIQINWPPTVIEGKEVVFDASDTFDPDNDPIQIVWDFGDGVQPTGSYITHVFTQEGSLTIVVKARDEIHEETVTRRITIKPLQKNEAFHSEVSIAPVSETVKNSNQNIFLNELYPNPTGSDKDEFIEIKNGGETPIDLSGWFITTQDSTHRYSIPHGVVLQGASYVLEKKDVSFNLVNAYDNVLLFSPTGAKIDSIDFDDAPSGMSYARTTQGDWLWTKSMSPGKENNVDDVYEEKSVEITSYVQQVNSNSNTKKRSSTTSTSNGNECMIVVAPGIIGKNNAYCADPSMNLHFSMQTIPALREGDRVRVVGKISHSNGQTRVTIQNVSDIHVLGNTAIAAPREMEMADISDDDLTAFVRVGGSVSKIQWPSFWINDGDAELRAYIYKTTSIQKGIVTVDDTVEISGILDKTTSGYRLLPRKQGDILVTKKGDPVTTATQHESPIKNATSQKGGYVLATLAALAIVSGGFIMQYMGKK